MKKYHEYPSGIGKRGWAVGLLSSLDAIRIGAWKQALIPASMSVNKPGHIEAVTGALIGTLRSSGCRTWHPLGNNSDAFWKSYEDLVRLIVGSKRAKSGLHGIEGVEYPTASAILCVLDPMMFPVIDKHAVRAIFGTRPDGTDFKTDQWYCATVYAKYARHLATEAHRRWPDLYLHKWDLQAMWAGQAIVKGGEEGAASRAAWVPVELPECLSPRPVLLDKSVPI
jgi:hypothetical protein